MPALPRNPRLRVYFGFLLAPTAADVHIDAKLGDTDQSTGELRTQLQQLGA
jgi:hypothetical protein